MKRLSSLIAFLGLLVTARAAATTAARSRTPEPRTETQQIIPKDTLRAGQDIELRKVQAMLSRQGPAQDKKPASRR